LLDDGVVADIPQKQRREGGLRRANVRDLRERRDWFRCAAIEDLKITLSQSLHRVAVIVGDDRSHLYEIDGGVKDGFLGVAALRCDSDAKGDHDRQRRGRDRRVSRFR
jgi:hypothetical protein